MQRFVGEGLGETDWINVLKIGQCGCDVEASEMRELFNILEKALAHGQ